MRIEKTALDAQNRCVYSLYKEKGCIGHAVTCADCFEALEIAPEWQSRGYGSYLLREVLRQNGGFDRTAPSEFTAPLPDAGNTAAQALAAKRWHWVQLCAIPGACTRWMCRRTGLKNSSHGWHAAD